MVLDDEVGSGQTGDEPGAGMERVPPGLSFPLAGLDDVEAAELCNVRLTASERATARGRMRPVGTRCIRTPSTISVVS